MYPCCGPLLFFLFIYDFHFCSEIFDFHLFAYDANLFYRNSNVEILQSNINEELVKVNVWLCANKMSLNIGKSNYVLFHSHQRKTVNAFTLQIHDTYIPLSSFVKYLGIFIDSNLNWKTQIASVSKKIKKSIGMLSKLRYFVPLKILINLYYALIYPFFTYSLIAWGNTYATNLQPLYILQKRAMRIITFSKFDDHSSPVFKKVGIIKLFDLITLQVACFMHKFHHKQLPQVFMITF